jgi:hypothetical protein
VNRTENVAFEPSGGATYYDGRPHHLGRVLCTVADGRLIVEDSPRGGVHQFLLRDVVEVRPEGGLFGPKDVSIATPAVAINLWCKSKDEVRAITDLVRAAIRNSC